MKSAYAAVYRFVIHLKRLLNEWTLGLQAGGGWNALFWNNHDQPRALNRFGDPGRRRYESATMLATAIHLLRGTPYILLLPFLWLWLVLCNRRHL